MTDMDAGDKLREEAAHWFARMRRPDKEHYREAFELWLGTNDNRTAYNRIAARFADAKILRQSPVASSLNITKRVTPSLLAIGVIAMCLFIPSGFISSLPVTNIIGEIMSDTTSYGNVHNEPMPVKLVDGSIVVLDAKSRIAAKFTSAERRIRLTSGRARFTVAHGARPFQVVAANAKVTAHGTMFDVAIIRTGKVRVALYSGKIEIDTMSKSNGGKHIPPLMMKPGEVVELRRDSTEMVVLPTGAAQPGWPELLMNFETVPLSEVVALANRHAAQEIVLADPSVGKLTLSGRFSIRESERLANHIARIFRLKVDRSKPGMLILRTH